MPQAARTDVPWAGLASGPTAWAISTQANYAMASWLCGSPIAMVATALALVVLALVGGILSWQAWHSPRPLHQIFSQEHGMPYISLLA